MLTMFVSGAIMAVALLDALSTVQAVSTLSYRLVDAPRVSLTVGLQILLVTTGLCLFEAVGFLRSIGQR